MTQHSAASHSARVRKQEGDALREALELEIGRHENTHRILASTRAELVLVIGKLEEARADLVLSRAAHDISRAEAADGRRFMAQLIAMLKRHGIEV